MLQAYYTLPLLIQICTNFANFLDSTRKDCTQISLRCQIVLLKVKHSCVTLYAFLLLFTIHETRYDHQIKTSRFYLVYTTYNRNLWINDYLNSKVFIVLEKNIVVFKFRKFLNGRTIKTNVCFCQSFGRNKRSSQTRYSANEILYFTELYLKQ